MTELRSPVDVCVCVQGIQNLWVPCQNVNRRGMRFDINIKLVSASAVELRAGAEVSNHMELPSGPEHRSRLCVPVQCPARRSGMANLQSAAAVCWQQNTDQARMAVRPKGCFKLHPRTRHEMSTNQLAGF